MRCAVLVLLASCTAAPLELQIDPQASFSEALGGRIVLAGTRGTVEIWSPGVAEGQESGPVEIQPTRVVFYLGDQRGRIHVNAGPPSPLPQPRGVEVPLRGLTLRAVISGGAREPHGWLEVGFPAFAADGLRIAGIPPVRLPIRGPYP